MSNEIIQRGSTIIINEVLPRMKKGGILPHPELMAFLVKLKQEGLLSHIYLRKILDAEMFKENWDKSLEELENA